MTIIQRNTYVLIFLLFILLLSFFAIFLGKAGEVKVSHVHIEKGDSLWSLADELGGGQPQERWIGEIMKINNLQTAQIKAGDTLLVPQGQLGPVPDATQFAGESE